MENREANRNVQYWITIAASLTSLTSSMSISWTTPVLPKFHNNETDIHITEDEASWLVTLTAPGMMTGSIFAQYPMTRCGRRATLMLTAFPFIIGTIFVLAATKAWMLSCARFIWGFGSGMCQIVNMVYITEIASKDIRGKLGIFNRFLFNFGLFLVFSIGSFISFQFLSSFILVLPLCYLVAFWFIPETPYFLLKEGKVDEAGKVLMKLNGYKDEKVLEEKLTEMRIGVRDEMQRSGSLKELLTGKHYRKALVAVLGLYTTRSLCGSIPLKQYVGRILQETKSDLSVSGGLIVFGAVTFITSMFSSLLVDKVGRRPLLIYSFMGAAILLGVLGGCFFMKEVMNAPPPLFGYINLFGNLLICIVSTLGFDTVGFIIPAELFPLNVKSTAMTYLSLYGHVGSLIAIGAYQVIKDLSGLYGVFSFFGFVAFTGALFTFYFIPETKGRTLREIQRELQGDLFIDTYNNPVNLELIAVEELKSVETEEGEELQPLKSDPKVLSNNLKD